MGTTTNVTFHLFNLLVTDLGIRPYPEQLEETCSEANRVCRGFRDGPYDEVGVHKS